ncbi:AAA family ATPase [Gammaproteobacteria bacterium AS21]
MRVEGFYAKGVFGYMDFNINFNEDVSFLVGGNGSGKTTALKLMNALVNPNFRELVQIPFDQCSIKVKQYDTIKIISASTHDGVISLTVSGCHSTLGLPVFSSSEFGFYNNREKKFEEFIDEINLRNAEHIVVKEITKISSPIFLGLDRRTGSSDNNREDYFHEREFWLNKKNPQFRISKRLITGSIGISLMETEMSVQRAYRRIRELEDKQSNKLRNKILLSSFQYTKTTNNEFDGLNQSTGEDILLARQMEIKEAISNIVGKDSSLSTEVDKFFNDISNLFKDMKQNSSGISIEWLLNKAQIERMKNIVDIIDEYKSKIDSFYKPINDFLNTVNEFYSDSKKHLKVDAVGQLVVERPDGKDCTIEGLSSGERQLLVIFSHAYFNRNSIKSNVFIIDEPELSLHLGWQEKFAETIFLINPNSQFILATHSPEIIGRNKNKAIKCR